MTDAVANTGTTASNAANLASGQSSLNQSFGSFLTLLTTQLQNQDPTQPMDANSFTQQLVAMTGVQQQLLSNQLLQQIATTTGNGSVADAVNLIGKQATAASTTATLSGGQAAWSYNLASAANAATITITDSTGKTVFSGAAPSLNAGANSFTWNGKDFTGAQLPDGGTYTMSVQAADASGNPITAAMSISGTVTSVSQANGQTLVKIGATTVPATQVVTVTASQ